MKPDIIYGIALTIIGLLGLAVAHDIATEYSHIIAIYLLMHASVSTLLLYWGIKEIVAALIK